MSCKPTSKSLCGKEECEVCYTRSFATHPRANCWHPCNELRPIQVARRSNKKFWFTCKECEHDLELPLSNVSAGSWCKYCNNSSLCGDSECERCFAKSFAAHPMAPLWSPDNSITPRMAPRGSEKRFWFVCTECNHTYDSVLYILKNENHCPYCANQRLCEKEDCEPCFNKSCASHAMATSWSPQNILTPRQVFLQSNKKIHFNCLACKHTYQTTPNHYFNRNGSCPYCTNKYLCDNTDCTSCFNKSFASHPKIGCWSPKNTIQPRNVFQGSETRCIFNCDTCHTEFESKLYNVLTGYWCPFCKNKTEAKMVEFLREQYSDCKTQLRFDWCRFSVTNNIMPFDFGLVDKQILVELDGEQHFTQISNWDSPDTVQRKDIEKIHKCIANGWSIIHIYQVDVWKDSYDWRAVMRQAIEDVEQSEPTVLFISGKDIYQAHRDKLNSDIVYRVIQPIC